MWISDCTSVPPTHQDPPWRLQHDWNRLFWSFLLCCKTKDDHHVAVKTVMETLHLTRISFLWRLLTFWRRANTALTSCQLTQLDVYPWSISCSQKWQKHSNDTENCTTIIQHRASHHLQVLIISYTSLFIIVCVSVSSWQSAGLQPNSVLTIPFQYA